MDEITAVIDTPALQTQAPTNLDELKPKMRLIGRVDRLELYGAFIDIGVGVNALIHISQLGEERVNRVSDVLNVGDTITVWIDKVNPETQQIMVTMIKPLAVDWSDLKTGHVYTGKVTRLENFGAFVDIGAEREGLVHISELSHDYVKHPGEVAKVDDEIQVQVLGFSKRKRRIDLSMKALMEKPAPPEELFTAPRGNRRQQRVEEVIEFDEEEEEELPTAMELALRRAMGDERTGSLTPPARRGKPGARKRHHDNRRRQQEDLLSRTLQMQD